MTFLAFVKLRNLFLLSREFRSIHEQVRFPAIVHGSDEIPDEHDMIWPNGLPREGHLCLSGCAVPFLIVAFDTSADQVLPCVFSPPGPGNDMVNGESDIVAAAILALVAIASQNILPGEDDLLERNTDVDGEANDTRKRHRSGNGMKKPAIKSCNQFGFTQIKKYDRFLNIADTERLVIMVEYEHLSVHSELRMRGNRLPIGSISMNRGAEVLNTSSRPCTSVSAHKEPRELYTSPFD